MVILFHHWLIEQTCSRRKKRATIILSPTFSNYYKLSGLIPPIIPEKNKNETGKFIGLKLNIDIKVRYKCAFKKRKKWSEKIEIFITSVYHPVIGKDPFYFNNYLFSIHCSVLSNYCITLSQDMKANIGIRNGNN